MIIFDCDGVLVDSESIANTVTARALTELGYPITPEEAAKIFVGRDSHEVRAAILSKINIPLPPKMGDLGKESLLQAYEVMLEPLIFDLVKFVADNDIPRCIVSNNTKEKILKALECTNQLQFFQEEHIFTESMVAKGKPDPELFLLAAKTLGYDPKDCIVIEDSGSGITGALAAKMKVIGFLGGSHAQYPWYQEKIRAFDISIADDLKSLEKIIMPFLGQKLP